MECRHKGLPAPEKFRTAPSAGKVMLTAVWTLMVHCAFRITTGATINFERNVGTLQ
jgi:hypothetical protein